LPSSTRSGFLAAGAAGSWTWEIRSLRWVVERIDSLLTRPGHRRLSPGLQPRASAPLARQRRPGSPGHHPRSNNLTGYLALWMSLLRRHPAMYMDTLRQRRAPQRPETLRRPCPSSASRLPGVDFTPRWREWPAGQPTASPFGFVSRNRRAVERCLHHAPAPSCPRTASAGTPATRHGPARCCARPSPDFRQVEMCLLGDFYPLTPYGGSDECDGLAVTTTGTGRSIVQGLSVAKQLLRIRPAQACARPSSPTAATR